MSPDSYHHGNLKAELIEKGLEFIANYGTENLSLRKLADSVGVSPAAPYAHFRNKEAFLSEVRDYITDQFYSILKDASDHCTDPSRILMDLGKSYVFFFYKNPLYYRFLFSIDSIDIENYPPFVLFKSTVENVLKKIWPRDKRRFYSCKGDCPLVVGSWTVNNCDNKRRG